MKTLITGGAGFIGARLASKLAAEGAQVTVLDSLSPQIHGATPKFSSALQQSARCIRGDVCDIAALREVVDSAEVIFHLAAETGTGQSMYAVERYSRANMHGTSALLELVVNHRPKSLRKIIVASSRAVYGEGKYLCAEHGAVQPQPRTAKAMAAGKFEPECPACDGALTLVPTSEDTPFAPSSFYGLTKQVQEQMTMMFGQALGIDVFALRFQNVYGPGQSLVNPYTGILAIFSNLVRQGKTLNIFEDGLESRDFVYIDDVVSSMIGCAREGVHGVHALNVGSGVSTSVLEVARAIVAYFRADVAIQVTGNFRVGDIRHNLADISRIRALTGYAPQWSFLDGLREFLAWASTHDAGDVGYESSLRELQARGLFGSHAS
jgi:dTDP-L-rhamnose 4-epimerase